MASRQILAKQTSTYQSPKPSTPNTSTLHPARTAAFLYATSRGAVFKEYIQEEPLPTSLLDADPSQADGHDSIEDARMALRLWRKFEEYIEAGNAEQMIEDIYRKGTRYGWKPPPRSMAGNLLAEAGSNYGSGRNTPDMGGASGPGTPQPRAPGVGFRFSVDGAGTRLGESPLR